MQITLAFSLLVCWLVRHGQGRSTDIQYAVDLPGPENVDVENWVETVDNQGNELKEPEELDLADYFPWLFDSDSWRFKWRVDRKSVV